MAGVTVIGLLLSGVTVIGLLLSGVYYKIVGG